MCVVPDGIDTFFVIECIVVNLAVSGVARRIQRSHIFILADIVTECVVNGLPATEHNGTCCISMAVVVLIVCSITIIRIPRLSVSITIGSIQCCKTFVVLENCIFTFPWPDTCCYSFCHWSVPDRRSRYTRYLQLKYWKIRYLSICGSGYPAGFRSSVPTDRDHWC